MSFKYGVCEREHSGRPHERDGKGCQNAVAFATEQEADAAGRELLSRWLSPVHYVVTESDDPVNYRFNFEAFRPEPLD